MTLKIKFTLILLSILFCLDSGLTQQQFKCGKSNNSTRIVGGQNADRLEWPWMALLTIFFQSSSSNRAARCGGSLISDEWVMTAAHCVNSPSGFTRTSIQITLGEYDVTRVEGTEVRTTGSQVFTNSFDSRTVTNDIALIKLSQKLDLKGRQSYLQPICLPSNGLTSDGKKCYATGWGTTSTNGRSANILQEVQLPILDNSTCRRVWANSYNPNKQLCAGRLEGGHDTCQGDSGGPLACPLSNGVWVQEGITSFGAGCAEPRTPGVYTRVSAYIPWIQRVANI